MSSPPLRSHAPCCTAVQAAGSLISGLTLTPGSDPEPASSFLREASSLRSGHPVCGPWRSAARNWRWPCPSCRTQQVRTPGRPVRDELGHAKFLARSDSASIAACRAAFVVCTRFTACTSRPRLAPPSCSELELTCCSVPADGIRASCWAISCARASRSPGATTSSTSPTQESRRSGGDVLKSHVGLTQGTCHQRGESVE